MDEQNEFNTFLENTELSQQLPSIADLGEVHLAELKDIKHKEFEFTKDGKQESFKKYVATYRDKEIVIPTGVLISIKETKKKLNFTRIIVIKSGAGLETKYNMTPMDPLAKV